MLIVECFSSTYIDLDGNKFKIGKFTPNQEYECYNTTDGYIFLKDDSGILRLPKCLSQYQFVRMFRKIKYLEEK